ncbi:MAG: hypothetical protein AB1449_14965 [Chloroflexota bacterium]
MSSLRAYRDRPPACCGWRGCKQLIKAINSLRVGLPATERWVYDFGFEVRVPPQTWDNYHKKLEWPRRRKVLLLPG